MGIIETILSLFKPTSEKEQYYQKKKETEETALADTVFWDKMDLDIFVNGKVCAEQNICPYCKQKLLEKKKSSFKCNFCKNKIHIKRELSSSTQGYYTNDEIEKIDELWSICNKRKKFLKLWDDANKRIPEVIPHTFDKDKSKNINIVLINLRLANIGYYTSENLAKLRDCRFIEGNIQMLYGTIPQATNCFMQILYLDIIDDIMKELNPVIAPAIFEYAFQENLSIDKYEKIFKFNAESLIKSLKFNVPVTPDDAWNRIVEYSSTKDSNE